jgi:hypothetical protein
MVVMVYSLCPSLPLRSGYNPLGAGSSRRPPSGAMGIPPAGARAPYRAPTGELLSKFYICYDFDFTFLYYVPPGSLYFGQEW